MRLPLWESQTHTQFCRDSLNPCGFLAGLFASPLFSLYFNFNFNFNWNSCESSQTHKCWQKEKGPRQVVKKLNSVFNLSLSLERHQLYKEAANMILKLILHFIFLVCERIILKNMAKYFWRGWLVANILNGCIKNLSESLFILIFCLLGFLYRLFLGDGATCLLQLVQLLNDGQMSKWWFTSS